jgi:FMN phosphatase YigB (HAD superfamily)
MKVYIAGKITGNSNFKEEFKKAELALKLQGHIVLSPADTIARIQRLEHHEYLHICYAMIDVADAVAFLPNWKDSKGAREEREYARKNGKEIILLEGLK